MPRLELYGAKSCPFTEDVRDWLELNHREFVEYDVESDGEARDRMVAMTSGQRTIPVLIEDGRVTQVGWQGRGCVV
jgi:glutaredoxin 3